MKFAYLPWLAILTLVGCTLYPDKPPAPDPPPIRSKAGAGRSERRAVRPSEPPPVEAGVRPEGGLAAIPRPLAPAPGAAAPAPYDSERPCLPGAAMTRAERALFKNYPRPDHGRWLSGINRAFFQLKIDCRDMEFLVLVISIIQQESGVAVDPPLENSNLEELLDFKLRRMKVKNPLVASVLSVSGIEQAVKDKLRFDNHGGQVKSEGDLVRYVENDLRPWFKDYLVREFAMPEPIAGLSAGVGIPNPVGTIGPMQVNVVKAFRNANGRGERIDSPAVMRGLLLGPDTALERGLLEGIHLLWKSYHFYRARIGPERSVLFAGADYNAGEFSSRNAAVQERVAAITKRKLMLDGDLLSYRNGKPLTLPSKTERALWRALPDYKPGAIRKDLLKEKAPEFSDTSTVRGLCKRYRARTKKSCAPARLPENAGGGAARIKLGHAYTPENYARAILKRYRRNRGYYLGD